ncbi:MAG: hypothetical protein M3Y40_02045 [Chloroflexota bacterium]|nr:hypothetical protein [Chloroflexota bacterium]
MRRTHQAASVLFMTALVLGACTGTDPSPDESQGPPVSAPASAAASVGASASASSEGVASLEPIPSEDLGPFSCDFPVVEDPSVAIANIVDVRYATHPDYDRVVFEFEQGTPELTLDRATPPFTQDASGEPITVDGDSFLRLTMRGGTRQTDEGTSSFDGPTDFDPGLPTLVDLVQGGDFERQSTWYLGLSAEACTRVLLLDGPPRLVIDVEHP